MKLKSLALLVASTMACIAQAHTASAEAPEGIWLVNGEAAVQAPRDSQGQLKRDTRNPRSGSANCAG